MVENLFDIPTKQFRKQIQKIVIFRKRHIEFLVHLEEEYISQWVDEEDVAKEQSNLLDFHPNRSVELDSN